MKKPNEFNPVVLFPTDVEAVYDALIKAGENSLAEMVAKKTARSDEDRKFIAGMPRLPEGDFDVDDVPVVSRGDDGAHVLCWSWVSNEMAGIA